MIATTKLKKDADYMSSCSAFLATGSRKNGFWNLNNKVAWRCMSPVNSPVHNPAIR